MSFRDLLDFCSAKALHESMEPTEEAVWDSICREYSIKFHTPLNVVRDQLSPEFVIAQVYANRLEGIDHEEHLEQILDSIYTMEDPSYSKEKAAEQQSFDEQAEKDEQERLESGESLIKHLMKKSVKKNSNKMKELLKDAPKPKTLPKTGGINMDKLAHLAAEEEEGGFKDE
jgi:hypothetical protein